MISSSKRFLFIHIPKTGGTSIRECLKDYNDFSIEYYDNRAGLRQGIRSKPDGVQIKHQTIEYFLERYPEVRDYLKFAVVRDPWDRLVSNYMHKYGMLSLDEITDIDDFVEFIKHRPTQLSYITIDGKITVDFVLRQETLKEDFKELLILLDINDAEELPRMNANPDKTINYKKIYTPEILDIVVEYHIKDIASLGYTFE